MHTFHETVLTSVSGYQVVATYDLTGYRDFNFQVHGQGQPGANFAVLIYFNQLQGFGEFQPLAPSTGHCIIQGTLPIYAPTVSIHVNSPSPQYSAKVRLYAACCGGSGDQSFKLKRASRRILRRFNENLEAFVQAPSEIDGSI